MSSYDTPEEREELETGGRDARQQPTAQTETRQDASNTTASEPLENTESSRDEILLELEGVSRRFETETALEELTLDVRDGEILTLLGPSGCGKTTTLRLLAGLDEPDAGRISLGDETVAGPDTFVAPEHRDVGLVFQSFALFPHLSVRENIAYGIQDRSSAEIDERVAELLELVDLERHANDSPDTLSGGQRQRVALARSLAPYPTVLLLDEPFSNLDVSLRREMREDVRRILKAAGVTAISVTHDQEEALSISDRVAVLHDGELEQVGRPETVFQQPTSRFVAEFLGEAGFVSGTLENERIETDIGILDAGMIQGLGPEYNGARIDVLVRPDDLRATPAEEGMTANGQIVHRQYNGPSFVYRVELDSGDVVQCGHNHVEHLELDQAVRVGLVADHSLAWFPAD